MKEGTKPCHILVTARENRENCSILIEKILAELEKIPRIRIEKELEKEDLAMLERTDVNILGYADYELADKLRANTNVKLFVVCDANRDRLVPVVLRLLAFRQAE